MVLVNCVNIINGEISILVAALKKNTKWSMLQHQDDVNDQTLKEFLKLKNILKDVKAISDIDQSIYLNPFLDTIICEDTTGPVTRLALTSLQKFMQYKMIDLKQNNISVTIDKIAHSLIHARFIGTDPSADEVVLQKILQVMQTLFFSPMGPFLSDQSVCGILHSFFRIAFEMRLAELLRHYSENALTEIFLEILDRLKYLGYNKTNPVSFKKTTNADIKIRDANDNSLTREFIDGNCVSANKDDISRNHRQVYIDKISDSAYDEEITSYYSNNNSEPSEQSDEHIRDKGMIKLTTSESEKAADNKDADTLRCKMYGYASVNELIRFIVNLTSPTLQSEKQHNVNSDIKIVYSLNLLTIAFETKAELLMENVFILRLVRDKLCRNLIELLKSEKITIIASTLRLAFFLFRSSRRHLKYQMEMFFGKILEIISLEGVLYQKKEYILDILVQFFKIPNFSSELYLNYDCDIYGSDILEDCTKFLSKNAFPITGIYSIHILSLEALFAIIDDISFRCKELLSVVNGHPHSPLNVGDNDSKALPTGETVNYDVKSREDGGKEYYTSSDSSKIPSEDDILDSNYETNEAVDYVDMVQTRDFSPLQCIKNKKKILIAGTEKFNSKPSKGIQYLRENAFFNESVNEESQIARFLRENPALDKKMVGEYLSNRKNLETLKAFVYSFDFANTRIDEALRMYLEAFRLPGEAPLISLMLENFAHHWHVSNGEPFANEDGAFALAYAVIMLNVDQHHQIVKKQMNPMNSEDFIKNLSKVNNGKDFDKEMLREVYEAIKSDEIIMPAEQTGIVKENYLWKILLRRSETTPIHYLDSQSTTCDSEIFDILWGPVLAASSYIFDKTKDENIINKIMGAFKKCASIANHFELSDVMDKLIITLFKFTNITNTNENPENIPVLLGNSYKSLTALKTCFLFVRYHGDILKEGWKYFIDLMFNLLKLGLLPDDLMELEDHLAPNGKTPLLSASRRRLRLLNSFSEHSSTFSTQPNTGTGLFSSFYSYLTSATSNTVNISTDYETELRLLNNGKEMSARDKTAIDSAKLCIETECRPGDLVLDSKFLKTESLRELLKTLMYSTSSSDQYTYEQEPSDFHLKNRPDLIMSPDKDRTENYDTLPSPFGSTNIPSNDNLSIAFRNRINTPHAANEPVSEDYLVFNLELLVGIIIQNRDRVHLIWPSIRSYFYEIIVNRSTSHSSPNSSLYCHYSTLKQHISVTNKNNIHSQPSFYKSSSKFNKSHKSISPSSPDTASHIPSVAPICLSESNNGKFTNLGLNPGNGSNLHTVSGTNSRKRPSSFVNSKRRQVTQTPNVTFSEFFLERAVIGLLRIATRLARKANIVSRVIGSLRILLLFSEANTARSHSSALPSHHSSPNLSNPLTNIDFFERRLSLACAFGLSELMTSAPALKTRDWAVVLACLERVGTGATLVNVKEVANENGTIGGEEIVEEQLSAPIDIKDVAYTSDSEIFINAEHMGTSRDLMNKDTRNFSDGWLFVDKVKEFETNDENLHFQQNNVYQDSKVSLKPHNPFSFVKCCDILSFLTAHLTLNNFFLVQYTLLVFVEAFVKGKKLNDKKYQSKSSYYGDQKSFSLIHFTVTEYLFSCRPSTANGPENIKGYNENREASLLEKPTGILELYKNRKEAINKTAVNKYNNVASVDVISPRGEKDYTHPASTITPIADHQSFGNTNPEPLIDSETVTGWSSDNDEASEECSQDEKPNRKATKDGLCVDKNASTENYSDAFYQLLEMIFTMRATAIEILYPSMITNQCKEEKENKYVKDNWIREFIWPMVWKPLFKGICRLCCDKRRHVRMTSLTYLQRALLANDLQDHLTRIEWEDCFNQILFPLMSKFLNGVPFTISSLQSSTQPQPKTISVGKKTNKIPKTRFKRHNTHHLGSISGSWLKSEESKHRACTLLCKVYLQRLNTLFIPALSPSGHDETFARVWLTILDYMDKFMHSSFHAHSTGHNINSVGKEAISQHNYNAEGGSATSDMLVEAIPESLKNMLLVMDTSGIFQQDPTLKQLTWERINKFLPKVLLEIRLQQEHITSGNANITPTNSFDNSKINEIHDPIKQNESIKILDNYNENSSEIGGIVRHKDASEIYDLTNLQNKEDLQQHFEDLNLTTPYLSQYYSYPNSPNYCENSANIPVPGNIYHPNYADIYTQPPASLNNQNYVNNESLDHQVNPNLYYYPSNQYYDPRNSIPMNLYNESLNDIEKTPSSIPLNSSNKPMNANGNNEINRQGSII
ncbi:Golgi-specific brefeldin A-resistance guanine nucleotide exchange factor 1-like isoform X2 [Gordionus sp. m RMFG-2023]|uniref:Golgi-specific brefeldin A-resistance guanine nucleotide exchange factor 1-like isoform X2 n=1 Tax=Gordionus sp. m RMFG-2023 TaxID=3053472 RepID=UPI0031FD9904